MADTAVVFWSGTGNTKIMAESIASGLRAAGAEADVFEVPNVSAADIAGHAKIAFGCPSMGNEVLEEEEFEPFFAEAEKSLSGKKTALFGSYGWGDGEWMRDWAARAKTAGAVLFDDGLIVQETPDEAACQDYGRRFAAF
ncbi:MAG: flavodoxin [Oscillospiraceae bacterium]|jgi:flavodoxin short chain|nr:flavodoxin [Oscillospiraceae bacterium]